MIVKLILCHPNEKIVYEFKIKLNGKKLHPLVDSHLNFSFHIYSISTKLYQAVGLLSKIRHCYGRYSLFYLFWYLFSSTHKFWGKL